jgi:hypothetical protein
MRVLVFVRIGHCRAQRLDHALDGQLARRLDPDVPHRDVIALVAVHGQRDTHQGAAHLFDAGRLRVKGNRGRCLQGADKIGQRFFRIDNDRRHQVLDGCGRDR